MSRAESVITHCPHCTMQATLVPDTVRLYPHCYRFVCPHCGLIARKPLDFRMRRLLLAAGARVVGGEAHPEPHDWAAPPLTPDDLIDLALALHVTECPQQFAEAGR